MKCSNTIHLILPMLRLLLSKSQGPKDFWKTFKLCHAGNHWIAHMKPLIEYSQMSTHLPGFQSFFRFLHRLPLDELATSSIRVNPSNAKATFVQNTWMQRFWKPSKPCHVGTHWIALAEYPHMSTHVPGFSHFLKGFFASFCIGQISHKQHKG